MAGPRKLLMKRTVDRVRLAAEYPYNELQNAVHEVPSHEQPVAKVIGAARPMVVFATLSGRSG